VEERRDLSAARSTRGERADDILNEGKGRGVMVGEGREEGKESVSSS